MTERKKSPEESCPHCGGPLTVRSVAPKTCIRCGKASRVLVVSNLTSEVVCTSCLTAEEQRQTGNLIFQSVSDHLVCLKCTDATDATVTLRGVTPPASDE